MVKIMKNERESLGLVLKTSDYQENAALINLLTPSGKLNLIVRGAKKINSKTRAFAIPLTLLQFEHTNNRELNTLTKCEVLDYYSSIKENPKLMFVAYAILEKINLIPMADQDDELFYQFVVDTLNLLKNTQYPDSLLAIFELKLLYLLGVNPRFNQCPICNKPVKDGCFSVEAAGVVCRDDCWNILTDLSFNHTKMMKYLYTIKLDKVDENFLGLVSQFIPEIAEVIDRYYQRYLDFTSKAKLIGQKMSAEPKSKML